MPWKKKIRLLGETNGYVMAIGNIQGNIKRKIFICYTEYTDHDVLLLALVQFKMMFEINLIQKCLLNIKTKFKMNIFN